jgi:hypothetical protein
MALTIVAASIIDSISMLPNSQRGKRKSEEIFIIDSRRFAERDHVKENDEVINMF